MIISVIGLGSMGNRRIKLIKKYNPDYKIIGIDKNEARKKKAEKDYGIVSYSSLEEALENNKVNVAFISTPPLSHNKIISECLENDINVFTELNLVSDGYDENIKLAKEKDLKLFISSTFIYRAEIKKIKEKIKKSKYKLNYTYHVGQYLPDWHPWESYKDFFVSNPKTNACREIFAIELPWIVDTFGEVKNIRVEKSKNTKLDLDYNDNYLLIINHKNGHKGTLAVDIVSRKAVRNLEVFGEDLYLSWDGSPKGLFEYNFKDKKDENLKLYDKVIQDDNYSSFVVENAYYSEIEEFFAYLEKGKKPKYTFKEDKEILEIIDYIER